MPRAKPESRPSKKPRPPKRVPPATDREFAERLLAAARRGGDPRVLAWVEGLTAEALRSAPGGEPTGEVSP